MVFAFPILLSIEELCKHQETSKSSFLPYPTELQLHYAIALLAAGKKVIDLSADFRLNSPETYKEFYGEEHPAKELLEVAQYGLPELHSLSWEKSKLIALPGAIPQASRSLGSPY
jgi:N-acetyl-gamma-glutamyl-phosphate reductase